MSGPEGEHGAGRTGRGPTSFSLHDPERVFAALDLKNGDVFVDLGCGPGDYSLHASGLVGREGAVYALDKWKTMLDRLNLKASDRGAGNILPVAADITRPLPLRSGGADICFMAMVMHALNLPKSGDGLFREMRRVLKPGGRAAILNFKKEDRTFGPTKNECFSPGEVEDIMMPQGFTRKSLIGLGHAYLIQFGLG